MRLFKSLILIASAGMALGGFAPACKAASITIDSVSVTTSGPLFTYTYNVKIGAGNNTLAGDYLNVIDFGGLSGSPTFASSLGGTSIVTTPLSGPTGSLPPTSDSPTITDILVSLSGQTNTNFSSSVLLGTLTAVSTLSPGSGVYGSQDHIGTSIDLNSDTTIVAGGAPIPGTPIPASIFGGTGLLGLLAVWKLKGSSKLASL